MSAHTPRPDELSPVVLAFPEDFSAENFKEARKMAQCFYPVLSLDPPGYAERVRALEEEGLTTSDAQGVADVEFRGWQYQQSVVELAEAGIEESGPTI